uniref:Uncharacterized protein n=1 Tax=Anguilla anguilla TaxID=7936 RepID=A0A0E9ULU2_ANGAN
MIILQLIRYISLRRHIKI